MELAGRVGEGTFKQTFKIVNDADEPFALKLYKSTGSTGRDLREIKAMLRCKHDNIARLLSVETIEHGGDKHIAITEEFLPGGTLTSRGRLDITQCLAIGKELVDALTHIAGLGLVHRDIKPDNIMFKADGQKPVLTDFGVVRDLADSSMTPTWAPRGPGTPFFAAPEQLNNLKQLIDWRTDQFALGVTMSVATFNDHPFREKGMTDQEVVDRVSLRQKPTATFLEMAIKNGLPALTRMVAPWPVDRFRTPRILFREWQRQKG